ncbi:MAG: hypothetical protein PQJ58_12915 [Spirochaetales bacterium]|nr:hypothetical protein [Spirochaetales bacterium]
MNTFRNIVLMSLVPLFFISCSADPLADSESLASFFEQQGFDYSIDKEGDFRIPADSGSIPKDVWIRGQLNFAGDTAVREIFSVSLVVSEEEMATLGRVLLQDNMQTRIMGSWSVVPESGGSDSNTYIVIYTVKAGINADRDYILQAVYETASAAAALERVLSPVND